MHSVCCKSSCTDSCPATAANPAPCAAASAPRALVFGGSGQI
ncbi:nucleoside-diphosphate sugar epimerase, partial [Xanthomonas oryzae pv. oryzae]